MDRLFGTNGVRGVVNKDLTAEKVIKLSSSAGALLGENIAIGRDGRTSSSMLREAVISGLLSVGCIVHDAGMVPTPSLQHSVKQFKLDGGLMITASHNPPEFNGVKVMAGDGVEVPRAFEKKIENLFFRGGPSLCPWDNIKKVRKIDALTPYKEAVISKVNSEIISKAQLKVALDPGNGVSTLTAPYVARELGCSVYTLNAVIDGRFPGRESEPRPDNLNGLKTLVEASDADVGVAFDGDGDRAIFIDEKGDIHWGDRSFALVVKDFLAKNPGEKVATSVSSSKVIDDVVSAGGGKIVWTRVGSVVLSRAMIDESILLGGEENGGIMYGPHLSARDGTMAMALILELMAQGGRPLSTLLEELPQYAQMKDRVACPDHLKLEVLRKLQTSVDAPQIETIDGVKLWYPDGSWILIRPSGTEPIFRLYAEAKDLEEVAYLTEKHKKILTDIVQNVT